LPIDLITDSFTDELLVYTQKNGGTTNLKIMVYDPKENVVIDFFSRSHRIALADELIDFLTNNSEIEFKLL
jgi:hypothetical protein